MRGSNLRERREATEVRHVPPAKKPKRLRSVAVAIAIDISSIRHISEAPGGNTVGAGTPLGGGETGYVNNIHWVGIVAALITAVHRIAPAPLRLQRWLAGKGRGSRICCEGSRGNQIALRVCQSSKGAATIVSASAADAGEQRAEGAPADGSVQQRREGRRERNSRRDGE